MKHNDLLTNTSNNAPLPPQPQTGDPAPDGHDNLLRHLVFLRRPVPGAKAY
jgi:hypothetical protein